MAKKNTSQTLSVWRSNTRSGRRVERTHEFLRLILPKGTSFDALTQADINKMMSHVNSYSRPALNDKAPFDLFSFISGLTSSPGSGCAGSPPTGSS